MKLVKEGCWNCKFGNDELNNRCWGCITKKRRAWKLDTRRQMNAKTLLSELKTFKSELKTFSKNGEDDYDKRDYNNTEIKGGNI